jgi:phosphatidylinositol alpha-mannosyltransferase
VLAIDEADCPVVGTFHTFFHRSFGYAVAGRYFQRRLERLDRAIAVSASAVSALERYFEADWTIIPNGVDTRLFTPTATRPLNMRDDKPAILFLGRLDPRNGLGMLLDVFRRIRGRNRDAQLIVVGDGPLRSHYERMAGGDGDVRFVGAALSDRAGYYANSAVYACPTSIASFGITLLESMACATPIACSNIPGFRDVVAHNREALMFTKRDAGMLADTLVHLLDDETLRHRLGQMGRQRSLAYDWSHITRRVLDEYASVLGLAAVAA